MKKIKRSIGMQPIAEPIAKKFTGQESVEQIAICVIELANVMNELHKKGIVHRDIKPSNIYFYKGGYCFGDFGLVVTQKRKI